MPADTVKLTVRLPRQDVEFAKEYARAHGLTVTEVIDRQLRRMRAFEQYSPSPALEVIVGLIPSDVDAREEYRQHLIQKHVG